ncbi:hypothetical protein Geob_2848 [Geotalea daltonii FRC-32]|uniref:Transcription factor zinc-finger domain-containing protein n=1 Tax=Geotalea daltonii (strain DSM 22248 / JCM 15807 / FRC-32) TaxID=316067 RepID=B9M275_GEODF|nr:zf-TFIIB domain-containing protein [Geotalea daltonii]ACM21193.1 hypothetical protein Geob_2848 [Geotalea daltonii FRC-32]
MKCPVCTNVNLLLAERQGVEIDYCPTCRGVWLDRGELDKILDRVGQVPMEQPVPESYRQPPPQPVHHMNHGHNYHGEHKGYGHSRPHKKKSLLSEIFDFD